MGIENYIRGIRYSTDAAENNLFRQVQDKDDFLSIQSLAMGRFGLVCQSYCLMENRCHFLIETPQGNRFR
jgi:hypothetical protein